MSTAMVTAQRRARFEAVRRRVFDEMVQSHVRMKFVLLAPYELFVLGVLWFGGYPTGRMVFQTTLFVLWTTLVCVQSRPAGSVRPGKFLYAHLAIFALSLANTGGLASPLMPLVLSMIAGRSVAAVTPKAHFFFFASVVGVFVGVAAASKTAIGLLPAPLAPVDHLPSPQYVLVALGALAVTTVNLFQFGAFVKSAYERVAIELATRREELCSEGADRTRALEGVAARLAHEVKNPLAAIKGLSTHMARQATDPKIAERLAIVAAESDRLREVVDGFLSFSRGLDERTISTVYPYEIARELTLLLETRAQDAQLTLEVVGSDSVQVNADARKLRQVLLNLVLNAMQASPLGQRVTIAVPDRCDPEGFLRIQVRDRGAGMNKETLERIQRPYFTTKEGGTGLGVAVARGLVEQHGGKMTYESVPGQGTTVTLALPRCARSAAGAQKQLPRPVAASSEDAAGGAVQVAGTTAEVG